MAQVNLRSVGKTYPNGYQAIAAAELTFNDGEFVVLVGPSGCGKSTLLRMVAGLEEISTGELVIGDTVANALSPRDRNIAMVFQNYALYPHMTVRDNLGFGLKHQKVEKSAINARIAEVAEMLELTAILDRKPKQLSGGQRQRVAVGRAIARQADVYLFDEPLSNLDASLRVSMRAEITRLHRRLKKTMVYVTHDQTEAMTMGDRIVVLKAGDVQQFDTPLNLYHFPANMFVAGFIGSPAMNFVAGRIVSTDGGFLQFQCDHDMFALPLDKAWAKALAGTQGRRVVMGIRPEHLFEAGTHRLGRYSEVTLDVDFLEATGSEAMVHLRLSGEDRLIIRDTFATLPSIDEKLTVAIDLAHLHFFDPETEKTLLPTEVAVAASTTAPQDESETVG